MNPVLLTLAMTALLVPGADPERKPNPFAPSLRLLTDDEEDKLDEVIDRFIDADLGKLTGDDAKKAVRAFDKLGPDAIPALIRGVNRAAKIEGSCPAAVITRKLSRMLTATEDRELLDFARENIGAGVGRSRHASMLQDLRVVCMLRKSGLARRPAGPAAAPGDRTLRSMSVDELSRLAGSERGERLKAALTELGTRPGDEATAALGTAAASYEKDVQKLARTLLDRQLARAGPVVIKDKLKDDRAEVRASAARLAVGRQLRVENELIDLLADDELVVRDAAHQALVRVARGTDYGPEADASKSERDEAVKKWRTWLDKLSKRSP